MACGATALDRTTPAAQHVGVSDLAPYRVVARNIDPQADNAIHDDDVAQRFGFAGALVPGVELFALATSPLVAAWGQQWLTGGRIDLRFRRPVYDGEHLLVELRQGRLTMTGPDGEVRCVGSAGSAEEPPDLDDLVDAPLPATLRRDPEPGPFGSLTVPGSVQEGLDYLDAIGEPAALYREQSLAHPGLLLRLVNLLLMRNVELGPWVHTSSSCRLLGLARLPAEMSVRGTVRERFERGGHDRVRYDAVVLADGVPVLTADHTAIYRLDGT
jgi:hypothetical protein